MFSILKKIIGIKDNQMAASNMAAFSELVGISGRGDVDHYRALHQWSVRHPDQFWSAVWDFCGLKGDKGKTVIQPLDTVPWARFFPDSKISYAENMLSYWLDNPSAPAIIARCQDGPDRGISGFELCRMVFEWECALRGAGIGQGDVVGVYLPNIPETIAILIAASNIGAPLVSAGMEMGGDDLVNRFGMARPKILITARGYRHGAKFIPRTEVVARAQDEISSLIQTVFIEDQDQYLAPFKSRKMELRFERRDFNHPIYILFSSGSTGKPKCFEHSTGGVLLKHVCEWQLNCDVKSGDRVFYHATPSWMMWNWLASGLASGATILMYDGSPAYPDANAQWAFTSAHQCTHHGTAAPVILSWAGAGIAPRGQFDLSPLRTIMSTGAVLPAHGFTWVQENVKAGVKIASISGGTDIVGCFVGGNPFTPTIAGQVNGPMLGMDVDIWDDVGAPVPPGGTGEMVCKSPFPSMPLRFLDDADGVRYRAEYFDHYPGGKIWRHGDSVKKLESCQLEIIGRSDATLNQNGVRIGPVAIYDQLKPFSDLIREAAAIDFTRPDNKQAITILFLALKDAAASGVPDDLAAAIRKAVKDNVTPYAVPTEIIAAPGVLKTPNGKTAEVVMKKIINGKSIPNPSLYGADLVVFYEAQGRALAARYGEK